MEVETSTLSPQLDSLRRERDRIEHLLMLDPNWRALKQLEAREATGEPLEAIDGAALKASLLEALATNRLFAARAKLTETIELLAGRGPLAAPAVEAPSLASRIVLLEPPAEIFRWRVRMKDKAVTDAAAEPSATTALAAPAAVEPPADKVPDNPQPQRVAHPVPDALELIDGFNRAAVEVLRDGGIATFAEIARWTSGDVAAWTSRLDGFARGAPTSWIEQAAVLASGRPTRYAARVRSGEFAALVARPEPLPPARPMARKAPASPVPRPAPEPMRAGVVAVDPAPVAHVSAVEIVAPQAAAPAAAPRRPPGAPPLLSAEELIRSLAKSDEPAPGAARRPYVRPDGRVPAAAVNRPGSVRPTNEVRGGDVAADSEVVVIRRDPAPAQTGFAAAPRPKPQRLLRRLKDVLEPERFEADTYAAYRSLAEEASVTIIRAGEDRKAPQLAAAEPAPAAEPAGRGRFLRALTGDR